MILLAADVLSPEYLPHWVVAGLVALVVFLGKRALKGIDDGIAKLDKKVDSVDRRLIVFEIQSDRLGRIRASDLERFGDTPGPQPTKRYEMPAPTRVERKKP